MRLAFIGFRHGHVMGLYRGAIEHPKVQVVAACEDDPQAAAAARAGGVVKLTHDSVDRVFSDVDCDAIAVGDYFARRGELTIRALEAGKHIIADKPLCTRLDELDRIEQLAAAKKKSIGCLLDLRDHAVYRTMRRLIREASIGEVHTVLFTAQHPLNLASRPAWYFEPGKHGGTINDIGVHAFDFVPWLTGLGWREITAARCWNAKAREFPHFHDCAQFMAVLDNGAGVLADLSYLAPDTLGYKLPHYWHLLVHGTRGLAEMNLFAKEVTVIKDGSAEPEKHPAGEDRTRGYIEDYLQELRGEKPADLTSADCLRASRLALEAQAVAGDS